MISENLCSTLTDGEPVVQGSRIHDLPYDQRPREKLALMGPAALSNDELMALFISTGTKGVSAIQIGRNLLHKYGSIGALGGVPVSQLAKEKGVGLAKASKLAAAFELGARVAREQVQRRPLDCPKVIYEFFGPQMSHLAKEQVVVAVLDTRLRHIGTEIISVGSVSESSAHPREVLRPVITRSAPSYILIHNHPSGDPSPSRSDESITRRLVEVSKLMQVHLLDHVIIGRPSEGRLGYYSFREAGLVP
jgi:DNA repair protein RadC